MELITQGILGAAVAQSGFQKRLGRRVALWGAIIGLLPDLDVLVAFMSDPFAEVLYHRGFTHSLWFAPLLAPLLGFLIYYWHNRKSAHNSTDLFSWIALSFWCLITHPLLDVFTVYGTQLLSPFTNFRFSFSSIPVVEPVYSLTLLSGVIFALLTHKRPVLATTLVSFALLTTSSYLFYGIELNTHAEEVARHHLESEGISIPRLRAYTTLFTLNTRRIVLQTPSETRIGLLYLNNPKTINWTHIPKVHAPYMEEIKNSRAFKIFDWFTDHDLYITLEGSTVTIHDSRFGSTNPEVASIWGLVGKLTRDGHLMGELTWFQNRSIGNFLSNLKKNLLKPSHESR